MSNSTSPFFNWQHWMTGNIEFAPDYKSVDPFNVLDPMKHVTISSAFTDPPTSDKINLSHAEDLVYFMEKQIMEFERWRSYATKSMSVAHEERFDAILEQMKNYVNAFKTTE